MEGGPIVPVCPFRKLAARAENSFGAQPSLEFRVEQSALSRFASFAGPDPRSGRRQGVPPADFDHFLCRADDPAAGAGSSGRGIHCPGGNVAPRSDSSAGIAWHSPMSASSAKSCAGGIARLGAKLGAAPAGRSFANQRVASGDAIDETNARTLAAFLRAATAIPGERGPRTEDSGRGDEVHAAVAGAAAAHCGRIPHRYSAVARRSGTPEAASEMVLGLAGAGKLGDGGLGA